MVIKTFFLNIVLLNSYSHAISYEHTISYDQLFQAAKSGNLTPFSTFKEFIEDNTFNLDVNAKDDKGNTFLHYAVEYGHLPIVHLLINKDANPHLTNNQGKTAFHIAVDQKNKYARLFCGALFDCSTYTESVQGPELELSQQILFHDYLQRIEIMNLLNQSVINDQNSIIDDNTSNVKYLGKKPILYFKP